MANILPSDIFAGYELVAANGTVTAESIVIPLTVLPELSAAEANETTGNGAQLIRAIDLAIHRALDALAEVERPASVQFAEGTERTGTFSRVRTISRTYSEAAPENAFDLVPEA